MASQPLHEASDGDGVEAPLCILLPCRERADLDAVFGEFQNQQSRPNRLPPWNIFTSRKDQSARRFGLPQLGGRIQPASSRMVPRCPEDSICRCMIARNISAATLRCEVVY